MPKEKVYGSELPFGDEDPRRSVVEVRWDADTGYFQIATKEATAELWVPGDSLPENAIPAEYGYYTCLDRRGINNLIRVLRRARDQAFGRDE
jgi:hypothetical protein